ncbi:MAG: Abi family protein, partial [Clostridia bacterium]
MPKPFMTYDQQIQLLKDKGLLIPDESLARDSLMLIGYFQLIGGYKRPFKHLSTRQYRDGVTFSDILALYHFDDGLRHVFLRQLLFVEREIKVQIAYCFCDKYGGEQEAYLNRDNYATGDATTRRLVDTLDKIANNPSDYPYINHQRNAHHNVPLWALINAITFGSMSKMFGCLPQSLQVKVCKNYPLNIRQMIQILSVLTKYRNACAHGERLFSYKTKDDIGDLQLHSKLNIPQINARYLQGKHDLFAVVIALRYLLPGDTFRVFKKEIMTLLARF